MTLSTTPTTKKTVKVRFDSDPAKVAGAIAHEVRRQGFAPQLELDVRAISEKACYVAQKAIARATDYLSQDRPDLKLAATIHPEKVTPSPATEADPNYTGYVFSLGWLI